MDKKTIFLIGGIVVVVAIIVFFQQYAQPNGVKPNNDIRLQTPSAPTPSPTSKPMSYPTIVLPDQEQEQTIASNSAEAFLITLAESNWGKQYDRLVHDDIKAVLTKEEFIAIMSKNITPNPIKLATVARVDFIKEYQVAGVDKKFTNVAVVQPILKKADQSIYTNPLLDFIYLAKDSDGNWKLLWNSK